MWMRIYLIIAELVRQGIIGPIDYAIIEAAAITEDGLLIPTTSVGNSPIFVQQAKNIIIELNMTHPEALKVFMIFMYQLNKVSVNQFQ